MRYALRGIDRFAAAHADQKIRPHRVDLRRKSIHCRQCARAAEGERTEQLHAACLKPLF